MPCAVLSGLRQPCGSIAVKSALNSRIKKLHLPQTGKKLRRPAGSIALSEVGIKSPEQRHNYTSIKQ